MNGRITRTNLDGFERFPRGSREWKEVAKQFASIAKLASGESFSALSHVGTDIERHAKRRNLVRVVYEFMPGDRRQIPGPRSKDILGENLERGERLT